MGRKLRIYEYGRAHIGTLLTIKGSIHFIPSLLIVANMSIDIPATRAKSQDAIKLIQWVEVQRIHTPKILLYLYIYYNDNDNETSSLSRYTESMLHYWISSLASSRCMKKVSFSACLSSNLTIAYLSSCMYRRNFIL